ncbi:E3 ubiquitin-protein ligase RNF168 [Monodelphis domestica]|uniref:E3 ubiquitin-protein ligase RNF168 n=1 Tax=Monodelphis domestica TaxID=13616 RepID=UPI0024E2768B|nr:E3 ubiquitin-protein ligase RNF168 [Monodelphis domestica]XP_016289020.2 E3 ubiquitin-protein ligase RNF168 [Monodelphis domestica]
MASTPNVVLPFSDCLCQICTDILIEPVTLPCSHTLCNSCFQLTVEKANLCCPFCRRRVSSWARQHARENTLINMELWDKIQKSYPEKCKKKTTEQDLDGDDVDMYQPHRTLSQPGELRREYEEEISKVEAERRAYEEEESKASEEYIQKLLAEEEEEQKLAEERKRKMAEQLKRDEELAREISINLNKLSEKSVFSSPSSAKQSSPVTNKSQKKIKNQLSFLGSIQKYLSPKSQFASVQASQLELATEDNGNHMSQDVSNNNVKSTGSQEEEEDEVMPTLTPQTFLESQSRVTKNSITDSPMPHLSAFSLEEECLEKETNSQVNNLNEVINGHFCANHEVQTGFLCSAEIGATSPRKAENGNAVSNLAEITINSIDDTENEDRNLLIGKESPKRKDQESPDLVSDSSNSAKRRKFCMEISSEQEETENNIAQKLIDLEHLLFERHKQEEQDRLLALELQREVDKEQGKLNRQKGSPDAYPLRTKVSLHPDESPNGWRKHSQEKNCKKQPETELSKPRRSSKDENWQPSGIQKKISANKGGKAPKSFKNARSLQPSNTQKSIFEMFQQAAK